jgi:ABC-type polar amino acid transport system ATPase subunit
MNITPARQQQVDFVEYVRMSQVFVTTQGRNIRTEQDLAGQRVATSALDPELADEVLQVMQTLAREGMTMLVVTHEMEFARQVAHRVVVLDAGTVLEQGPPSVIFSQPSQPRTREFLRKVLHVRAENV